MKIITTYKRRLRTSRRFVFENVFDLEHVCVLHRRWFRNLRIRVQRPDYVEYRLTSLFYGLRQETIVKGAPIDSDRYWYEFHTLLARMRVDGWMEGPDGDLTLTENIAYEFRWFLVPFFWLLRPLFRRQKDDILQADSSLLERVYDLAQKSFRRREVQAPKVVVYGGDGFFGRLVVEDLIRYCDVQIIVASRHPELKHFLAASPRLKFVESDLNDYGSVLETIHSASVAISCAGPFQGATLNLLRACIEKKVHYVDVADDRTFVKDCFALRAEVEKAGIIAVLGCSVVPGLSTLLCASLRERLASIDKTFICISPGTRHPRGPGSFLCLLSTVGTDINIPAIGMRRSVRGWSGRQCVQFPAPMGPRWVYFVVDIPDYFLQPLYFNTPTVEFKIGSELDSLNRCLSLLRLMRGSLGFSTLRWFLPLARSFVYVASLFGTSQGGVIVEVSGRDSQGNPRKLALCVFAVGQGEIVPAILPSVATQMILAGEFQRPGIVSHVDWLPMQRLRHELCLRNVEIAFREDDSADWSVLSAAAP